MLFLFFNWPWVALPYSWRVTVVFAIVVLSLLSIGPGQPFHIPGEELLSLPSLLCHCCHLCSKRAAPAMVTIMRIGWWTSLTYLTYINFQIGALSASVAWKISQEFTFQNVG
jgi:hypothetical protein